MHCAVAAPGVCFVLGATPRGRATVCRAQAGAKAGPAWTDKATVAGGGFKGACDIDAVKTVIEECSTLEGERQKACWASSGCDIDVVTQHYVKAAGLKHAKK